MGDSDQKSIGFKKEADVSSWQRVVFRTRDVGVAEGIPEHDIGIVDRSASTQVDKPSSARL
jgi:hypothetical protein